MSIENTIPAPTAPPLIRVLALVVHSGIARAANTVGPGTQIANEDGTFTDAGDGPVVYGCEYTTPPYVEVISQKCEKIVDGDGNDVLNAFGMSVYTDLGSPSSFQLTDMNKLLPFLQVWGQLIDAAEGEILARNSA